MRYPIDRDSALAQYEINSKRIDPQSLEWIYCHLKMEDGAEVFSMVHERSADLLMMMPILVIGGQNVDGDLQMDFNPLNPFTADIVTSVSKARVVTINNLSDRYRLIYKKALQECFGYMDKELAEKGDMFAPPIPVEENDLLSLRKFKTSGKPN